MTFSLFYVILFLKKKKGSFIVETKIVKTIRNNKECVGYADVFNEIDLKTITDIYFKWKKLNKEVQSLGSRRINLPEIISEGLACLVLNLVRTNATNFSNIGSTSFDCLDVNTGTTYQLKAVSTLQENEYGGLSSFGPRSEADKIILLHFICEKDRVDFYLCDENIDEIKVNKDETFKQQCEKGKRPRFKLLQRLKENKTEPMLTWFLEEK